MIQVQGLTKYYGKHAAIRDLAFTIERGEVIGFLGLNGAGKTTTLKILGCVLLPTAGHVTIDGIDVTRDPHEIRKRIGYLPDTPPLYDEMTVRDYLLFVAQLRGLSRPEAQRRVGEVEEQTGLREVDGDPITSLSHGYRQRVGVAQAVVHNPALLILDEPTSGLDPVQIVEMRELIKRLKGSHTILVSSHILPEISQTCDRLLVIQNGELVAQGTEEQLAQQMGGAGRVEVEVRGAGAKAAEVLRAVPGVSQVQLVAEQNGVASLRLQAGTDLRPQVARALVGADLDLLRIDRGASKLENIFLTLTHGKEQAS